MRLPKIFETFSKARVLTLGAGLILGACAEKSNSTDQDDARINAFALLIAKEDYEKELKAATQTADEAICRSSRSAYDNCLVTGERVDQAITSKEKKCEELEGKFKICDKEVARRGSVYPRDYTFNISYNNDSTKASELLAECHNTELELATCQGEAAALRGYLISTLSFCDSLKPACLKENFADEKKSPIVNDPGMSEVPEELPSLEPIEEIKNEEDLKKLEAASGYIAVIALCDLPNEFGRYGGEWKLLKPVLDGLNGKIDGTKFKLFKLNKKFHWARERFGLKPYDQNIHLIFMEGVVIRDRMSDYELIYPQATASKRIIEAANKL